MGTGVRKLFFRERDGEYLLGLCLSMESRASNSEAHLAARSFVSASIGYQIFFFLKWGYSPASAS
jgi:hypothetical protein